MSMTNHPVLQPVLTEGSVNMLVSYIYALKPDTAPDRDPVDQVHYVDGYLAACAAASRLVRDMWRAAEIATAAVNESMLDAIYLDPETDPDLAALTFEDDE